MTVLMILIFVLLGFILFLLGLGMAVNILIKKQGPGKAAGWGFLSLFGFLLTAGFTIALIFSLMGYAGQAAYKSIKKMDLKGLKPDISAPVDSDKSDEIDSVQALLTDAQGKSRSIRVRTSRSLATAGIKLGRSAADSAAKKSSLTAYLVFSRDFRGSLRLRLFDADDREAARADAQVAQTADSSNFIPFVLDARADLASVKYAELRVQP